MKQPGPSAQRAGASAFTLIEMMIVVGIMAIVMGVSIPLLVRTFRREALRQAVCDIVEVASNARAMAIQRGETVDLVFDTESRTASVGGGGGGEGEKSSLLNKNRMATTWPDSLTIEMLDVNFVEHRAAPKARVRFFPNGTCDEATLILRNDANEFRMVYWEVLTGLADWEADPNRFAKKR
jgi:prepilin-type N-terminal cleavage/methylation domain-containing protein